MDYGHPKHISSEEDRTVIYCRCGWHSDEMSKVELGAFGVPWYCGGGCNGRAAFFITFHPNERAHAYASAHLELPKQFRPKMEYSIICSECFTRRPGDVDICPSCGKDNKDFAAQGRAIAASFAQAKGWQ